MPNTLKKVLNRLLQAGLADESAVEGCTEAEIAAIESHYGIRLPGAYRDFLSIMGKSAGSFLVGTDYSFSKLLGLHDDAVRLSVPPKNCSQCPACTAVIPKPFRPAGGGPAGRVATAQNSYRF